MNRPLRLILLLSLIGNVLLLGMLGGLMTQRFEPSRQDKVAQLLAPLPAERRAFIAAHLQALHAQDDRNDGENDRIRQEITRTMQQPQFDPVAYKAAVDRMVDRRNRQRTEAVQAISDLAAQLNQPERVVLTQVLEAEHPHPPRPR